MKTMSDKEIPGDDIKESSTPIPPETTPVITEFVEVTYVTTELTDIPPKDSTPISPKLIHVITGIAKVLREDLPDRLQPCVISNTSLIPQEIVFLTCHTIGLILPCTLMSCH